MNSEVSLLKKELVEHISEGNMEESIQLLKKVSDMMSIDEILQILKQGIAHFEEKYFKGAEKVPFTFTEIMVYETIGECLKLIKDKIKEPEHPKGTIVIGVIRGDVHDIGKNMVATMLMLDGFKVIDLGFDVDREKFIEAVVTYNPDVLAISAFMPFAFVEIPDILALLKEKSLQSKVKVIIGGGPITEEFANKIGVLYARSASEAVDVVNNIIKEGLP